MEPVAAGAAAPCQILDDDELEKQGRFRAWRQDPPPAAASAPTPLRTFGGSGAGGFPSAFQTYRSGVGAAAAPGPKTFPFQVQKKKAGAAGAAPKSPARPAVGGEPGKLVADVLNTFQVDPLITEITEKGFHLLDIHTGEERRCDPPYAPCTPPQCHSPKTPPLFEEEVTAAGAP